MKLHDDEVIRFLDACTNAGIRNPSQFLIAKMPQVYSWLKGCFPRGILPTDVDGEVEINAHFLRLEFKLAGILRDGCIPKGQESAFRALIKLRHFTVLLIGLDETGEPVCVHIWYPNGKRVTKDPCDRAVVQGLCRAWSAWAAKQPPFGRNGQ